MAITLIVKSTRKCNIRCTYCHDWRDRGNQSLSFKNLARLTKDCLDSHQEVNFIWHGGEPLLLGISWFERAIALQTLFRNEEHRITNSLQTNATLIDADWLSFFREYNFSVGVSIDGPPETHDIARVDAKGHGTYRRVIEGLNRIREANIPNGILVVITEKVMQLGAKKIYDWLKEERINSVGFLPQRPDTIGLLAVREPSPSSEFLSRDGYADFMQTIAELWWNDSEDRPSIREFETFVNGLVNQRPGICIYQGSCVGKYFGIDPNGDVYHCDRYIPEPSFRLGNLDSSGKWIDIVRLKNLAERAKRDENLSANECHWHSVCHGGCPHDRHADKNGWASRGHCCGMRPVIEFLASRITESLPPALRANDPRPNYV